MICPPYSIFTDHNMRQVMQKGHFIGYKQAGEGENGSPKSSHARQVISLMTWFDLAAPLRYLSYSYMTGNLGVGVLGLGFGGVVAGLYVRTVIINLFLNPLWCYMYDASLWNHQSRGCMYLDWIKADQVRLSEIRGQVWVYCCHFMHAQ